MKFFSKKILLLVFFTAVSIGMAYSPIRNLLRNAQQTDYYSHIVLIPVVSAFLLFRKRRELFGRPGAFHVIGIVVMAVGVALFFYGRAHQTAFEAYGTISTVSALLFWWGSFLFLFGIEAIRKAYFPLAFLVFAIPLPAVVMDKAISFLVSGSIGVTHFLFKILGVPFIQEGSIFKLPGFSIEVARECSSIRSSLALLITCILAGHLFLKKFRNKALLVLAVLPVAVFKNGVRIVTLYLLSYYVDMRIIEGGFLHQSGGFIFFGLGLVILGGVLWLLRRTEVQPRFAQNEVKKAKKTLDKHQN